MKIIHLIFSLNIGGAELLLIDLLNCQSKSMQVQLVVVNNAWDPRLLEQISDSVSVSLFKRKPRSLSLSKLVAINVHLFKENPDIIHCHNHNLISLLNPFFWKKTCLTVHCMDIPIKYLKKYSKVFTISESVSKNIKDRIVINLSTVPNGVDIKKIKRKKSVNKNDYFKLICVSRLDHLVKGQDLLIDAVRILLEETKINLTLTFIGDGPSGIFLNDLINKFELNNYVSFIGVKDRYYIYDNLCNYDLLIQPSLTEGFGLTIIEAMTAGVPVLVSDIKAPMEIICNGRFGDYFKARDVKDLSLKISNILSAFDKVVCPLKTEDIFLHVEKNYSLESTAKLYMSEYFEIL